MLNQDLRRFAPWGLYLSVVALLASGVIYILTRQFGLPLQISLFLVLLGIALWIILDPSNALATFKGRQARYGSNALALTLGVLGILVIINFLVYQNSKSWDLTQDKTNTLAPETLRTLSSLKGTVKAEAFYSSQYPMDQTTRALLDNYKLNGKGKFSYQIIDPIQNPVAANQAKVTRDGTIVLVEQDRMEQVTSPSEQELTAALVRLENPGQRVVYFLTGHGEHSPAGTDQKAYAQVKTMLTSKNYTVNSLDLLSKPSVPADARVVVVAGPIKPLSDSEVKALKDYLDRGGALVYLSDPIPSTEFGSQPDPLADYLQKTWGITLGQDVVIDFDNQQQPLVAIGSQFGQHTITTNLANLAVGLPIARSVSPAKTAPANVTLTQLVSTAQNSWGETDYQSINNQQVSFDKNKDMPGPVPLAVAGANSTTKARVVVIGDSDFASDQFYRALGNADLFVNSVDWSAQEESMISLTPKQQTTRMLVVPNTMTMGLILIGSVFLLPGIFLLLGISTIIQRRRHA